MFEGVVGEHLQLRDVGASALFFVAEFAAQGLDSFADARCVSGVRATGLPPSSITLPVPVGREFAVGLGRDARHFGEAEVSFAERVEAVDKFVSCTPADTKMLFTVVPVET